LHADCRKRHEIFLPQNSRPLWQPLKLALGFGHSYSESKVKQFEEAKIIIHFCQLEEFDSHNCTW
jgi:hypothetical protein